jgi:Flp pilus assembly protein TadB
MAFVSTLFVLIGGMVAVATWMYRAKQNAEEKANTQVVKALTESLDELKVSLKDTAAEVFSWVRGAEHRISRLEAQHEVNHGRRDTDPPRLYR